MTKVGVHELAKELGVESKVVLAQLREMGEFVKSASSTIPPHVVRRFRVVYGAGMPAPRQPQTPPAPYRQPRPAAQFERRIRPNPFASSRPGPVDPKLAEAARMLGVPVHELKPAKDDRPRRRREQEGRPITSWDEHFFTDAERRRWQAEGLGVDDGRLAWDLAQRGVAPEDLRLRVPGRRVVEAIRGGEPVAMVVAELLEVKRQQQTGGPAPAGHGEAPVTVATGAWRWSFSSSRPP